MREKISLFRAETDLAEKVSDLLVALCRRSDLHQVQRLAHDGAGTFSGIERRIRILEDDLEPGAGFAERFAF